jgi:NAD(P)-dependent dehydrogenase (short-subunit alcohol dehydrogenase family)
MAVLEHCHRHERERGVQDFTGKVAVVTGGASGIGRALAQRFAAEGMHVVVGDVEKAALDAVVAELSAGGTEVLGVLTDVSDAAQVAALADATVDRFGGVHVVCNNAGVGAGGTCWEAPLETWEWVLGVNLWGVIHGLRSFVPLLLAQGEGHVVNTASMAGVVAPPFMGPYNASKHAVVAISESLHHELALAAPGVKVSVLCPGWVRTRIADSDRNRPERYTVADDTLGELREAVRSLIEGGMPPEGVADKVVAAIRDERFWILTHDDDDDVWSAAVARRLDSLRDRANPPLVLPM